MFTSAVESERRPGVSPNIQTQSAATLDSDGGTRCAGKEAMGLPYRGRIELAAPSPDGHRRASADCEGRVRDSSSGSDPRRWHRGSG